MPEIRVEIDSGVATLTLNAPARRNALTVEMADDLLAACDRIDGDPMVGAVVVAGAGKAFCAGAHRDLLATIAEDPADGPAFTAIQRIYDSFARVGRLEPPTIAAVRGPAVGAGLNLALATDLRIVAHEVALISGFVQLEAHPGGGHFALLARAGGREVTAALGLFGRRIDGRDAARIGLAWEALPEDEVEPRAWEIAAEVAARPDLARQAARSFRMVAGPPGLPWEAALQLEQAPQMWSFRTGPLRRAQSDS